jgi:transcriptional regulator with XRE-family HTH domain
LGFFYWQAQNRCTLRPLDDYQQQYAQFRSRLREARLQAGLTQKQVAEQLGKPQSFVAKVEAGERRLDFIELCAFCELYGVNLDYFR